MQSVGIVKKIINGNTVIVAFERESSCGGNCTACGACKRYVESEVTNKIGAKVSDRVKVESNTLKILGFTFMLYIVPIIVFLTVYILVFNKIANLYAVLAGFICSAFYFFVLKQFYKNRQIGVEIVEVINE